MTAAKRLELVRPDERDPMGEETQMPDGFQPIDVDPNAVSDLAFRLQVSNRLLAAEKLIEQQRRTLNRILTRFAIDGKAIPTEDVA